MLIFRDAVAADLPAIVALLADDERGATREDPSDPLPAVYAAAFADILRQEGNAVVVGERDGEVVACLQLTFIANISHRGLKRAQIEGVRVASGLRGQGIGEQLMGAALSRARDAGCGLVQLTTNLTRVAAQRFYKRLGFEASHFGMKMSLD
jgi:ribosomal protein S18 acetylase RimI-like enzyme